jgi:type VI secretion system protein ImpM
MSAGPKSVATGWYGKVPARGDFVSRGIEPALLAVWDAWLQSGLKHAAQALGPADFELRLRGFPPWRWLAWPDGPTGDPCAGVLVASQDRVGRAFPLLLQQHLAGERLARLGWLEIDAALARLSQAATAAADPVHGVAFEAALSALGNVFDASAPARAPARKRHSALQLLANSPGTASLWWTAPAEHTAPVPLGESWPPHTELLLDLLGAAPGPA